MDWQAAGAQPDSLPKVTSAPTGQREVLAAAAEQKQSLGGDWTGVSVPGWSAAAQPVSMACDGPCGGSGACSALQAGAPLSCHNTGVAGECPPWQSQWHRHDAGAAGQPMPVPHIHRA